MALDTDSILLNGTSKEQDVLEGSRTTLGRDVLESTGSHWSKTNSLTQISKARSAENQSYVCQRKYQKVSVLCWESNPHEESEFSANSLFRFQHCYQKSSSAGSKYAWWSVTTAVYDGFHEFSFSLTPKFSHVPSTLIRPARAPICCAGHATGSGEEALSLSVVGNKRYRGRNDYRNLISSCP